MNSEEFRRWGTTMVNFIADYWESLRQQQPIPNVLPGEITKMLPTEAPQNPESWESIFDDLNPIVINGSTHWQHPHFFAYYPAPNSYPSIMADMLSGALGTVAFNWLSSPACTEIEFMVMDWLAKMLKLPEHFLNSHAGHGAGIIQSTASDSTLLALLAARSKAVMKPLADRNSNNMPTNFNRFVVYCSDQAHSSVEKAANLAGIKLRSLESDENFSLRGCTLEQAICKDLRHNRIPIALVASLGTTNSCGFDNLLELGPICEKYKIWLHIDAAYAGSAFICPEFRHWLDGVEYASSFNFNPHKMLQVTFDCSAMWFRDSKPVEETMSVDPVYLQNNYQSEDFPDVRNLEIPLGRRFRSLKLWFVIRNYGISGLQQHVRSFCHLAKVFQKLVDNDNRFSIVAPVELGLVVFRYNGSNELNELILNSIVDDKRIYMVPTNLKGQYAIRFAICSTMTTESDIQFAWNVIVEITEKCLATCRLYTQFYTH